jgi:hypothetical protein
MACAKIQAQARRDTARRVGTGSNSTATSVLSTNERQAHAHIHDKCPILTS